MSSCSVGGKDTPADTPENTPAGQHVGRLKKERTRHKRRLWGHKGTAGMEGGAVRLGCAERRTAMEEKGQGWPLEGDEEASEGA